MELSLHVAWQEKNLIKPSTWRSGYGEMQALFEVLFRTLLHELMTAKIRVNQIELDKPGAVA